MTRFRVLPYRQGSASAKALAEALGGKVLKLVGSKFKPKPGDIIINWGNTKLQTGVGLVQPVHVRYNGDPFWLNQATNKLKFFDLVKDAGITPRFWTKKEDIPNDAYPIVCRTVLAGHSGDGIVIAESSAELVAAPLYVEYKKKKDEYRVHCAKTGDGSVTPISIQRKARRTGAEVVNWKVRNLANGFVFVRNNVNPPVCVEAVARSAFELSGLDFGAVDVIFNQKEGKAYVLEINTAPGLEGQTITDYSNYFKGVVG